MFQSHPRMSVWSTSKEELLESRPNATLNGIVDGALEAVYPPLRAVLRPFVRTLFWPLMQIATQVRPVKCKIRPLSQHIDRLDLNRIDLLKVDVEGAEMSVLRGVSDKHWPRVQAVVVETEPGNREPVLQLLQAKGFSVRYEEPYSKNQKGKGEKGHGGSQSSAGADKAKSAKSALAMVYAERESEPAAARGSSSVDDSGEGSGVDSLSESEEAGPSRRRGGSNRAPSRSRGSSR